MVAVMDGHVVVDDKGVARVADSRIRVIDLILDRQAYGWTPEEMHQQFPHLSMAQIHAAFAYYYDHQAELDADIEHRRIEVEKLRAEFGESPLAKRLRAEGPLP
jgi:uncharacterized protein (DUF433 family)